MNTQEYKSLQCVAGGFNDIQLERPDENYENGSLLPFLVHDWRKEKECQVSWSDNDDDGDVGGAVDGDVDGDDNVDVDVGGAVNGDGDGDGAVDGDIYVDADVDADADGNGDDDGDGGEEGVTRKRRAISLGLMRGQIFRLD